MTEPIIPPSAAFQLPYTADHDGMWFTWHMLYIPSYVDTELPEHIIIIGWCLFVKLDVRYEPGSNSDGDRNGSKCMARLGKKRQIQGDGSDVRQNCHL